ncbi:tripartite tricarboxylate transporter TctB family protein [Tuberibacillus sp. Marseille-P3662]|uniref:tripartite tricarboxylate transporter TctB family protein n=1 Tax=Tuberibacillus sp. Marseille-P3662 TaxID=1965358 RepID=UPI000A1C8EE5|nr:tripartite tricarboxylate transporter TctB family protein [Tuberibacillus sp. Marseille-P3662]
MVKAKRDCMNAILILVFCGFVYFETLSISAPAFGKTGGAFFPKIVISIVALLGICLLINSLFRMKKETTDKLNLSIPKLIKENKKVLLTFIIFGTYVVLLGLIGYIISTMLFLMTLYLLLTPKIQKVWIVGLGYIVLTLIVFFIFQNILSVFLPKGTFF